MVRGFSVINELEKWQGKGKKLNQRKNYRMVNMVNYELKTTSLVQVWEYRSQTGFPFARHIQYVIFFSESCTAILKPTIPFEPASQPARF